MLPLTKFKLSFILKMKLADRVDKNANLSSQMNSKLKIIKMERRM